MPHMQVGAIFTMFILRNVQAVFHWSHARLSFTLVGNPARVPHVLSRKGVSRELVVGLSNTSVGVPSIKKTGDCKLEAQSAYIEMAYSLR